MFCTCRPQQRKRFIDKLSDGTEVVRMICLKCKKDGIISYIAPDPKRRRSATNSNQNSTRDKDIIDQIKSGVNYKTIAYQYKISKQRVGQIYLKWRGKESQDDH